MKYDTLYRHKTGGPPHAGPTIELSRADLVSGPKLAAALRKHKILLPGEGLGHSKRDTHLATGEPFKIEASGKIVAFPRGSIWWSISLTPKD